MPLDKILHLQEEKFIYDAMPLLSVADLTYRNVGGFADQLPSLLGTLELCLVHEHLGLSVLGLEAKVHVDSWNVMYQGSFECFKADCRGLGVGCQFILNCDSFPGTVKEILPL